MLSTYLRHNGIESDYCLFSLNNATGGLGCDVMVGEVMGGEEQRRKTKRRNGMGREGNMGRREMMSSSVGPKTQ